MNEYLDAALRLHRFMRTNNWTGHALCGPDQGVRFNRRLWRYVKSALPFYPWADNTCYMQAQGYWVFDNWLLFDLTADKQYADFALKCTQSILAAQLPAGYWEYPHSEWEGRISTVEGIWASLGLLETYERTGDEAFLQGALKSYEFLFKQTGFKEYAGGLAINYFANMDGGLVPNNTTLFLPFLAKLAALTDDDQYLKFCPQMITFLTGVQLKSGEIPYARKPSGEWRAHYQCYQYNAFELQDLVMYYQTINDDRVLPLIALVAQFLIQSVRPDGSTRFDCHDRDIHILYNSAAIAAALGMARQLGLGGDLQAEDRVYSYLLSKQNPSGGFPFSTREYGVLVDRRYYPRPLSMLLYHLLLKSGEFAFRVSDKDQKRRLT